MPDVYTSILMLESASHGDTLTGKYDCAISTDESTNRQGTRAEAFANAGVLATTSWLADRLHDPGVKIVDARYVIEMDEQGRFHEVPGRESFLESHIPGAVFLNLDDLRNPARPAHILDSGDFGTVISRLGIGDDDEAIVYDTDGGVWAARLWWALRLYGHRSAKLLNGGFKNWTQEGRAVEAGETSNGSSRFTPCLEPNLRAEIGDVVTATTDPGAVIVDGLSAPFHDGTARLFAHLPAGHIPGAVNIPAPTNLDPETHRLLPVEELIERWRPVVDGAERIITYCGIGMYGAFDLFVLHLLGYDAALYDGSWEEWAANEDLPIATAQSVALDQG